MTQPGGAQSLRSARSKSSGVFNWSAGPRGASGGRYLKLPSKSAKFLMTRVFRLPGRNFGKPSTMQNPMKSASKNPVVAPRPCSAPITRSITSGEFTSCPFFQPRPGRAFRKRPSPPSLPASPPAPTW